LPKNDLLQTLKKRKTTYEFSEKKVKSSDIKKILEAGRWAPSAHNSQPWKFIVIQNKGRIKSLMKLCHYGAFYSNPCILIAIVLEKIYERQKGLFRGSAKELAHTHKYMNIGFAASYIVLEASSLGLDTCILSPVVADANKILGVPKGKETLLFIGMGYELKGAYKKQRSRKMLKDILSYEKY
jgi:nitroreductase